MEAKPTKRERGALERAEGDAGAGAAIEEGGADPLTSCTSGCHREEVVHVSFGSPSRCKFYPWFLANSAESMPSKLPDPPEAGRQSAAPAPCTSTFLRAQFRESLTFEIDRRPSVVNANRALSGPRRRPFAGPRRQGARPRLDSIPPPARRRNLTIA